MFNKKVINKVTDFLAKEFTKGVNGVAIFKNEDGTYELFDKFNITPKEQSFIVTVNYDKESFSSLKNAVTWCVCENQQKYVRAKRVKYLDDMIGGTEVAIDMHKKLLKKSKDMEHTLIHLAKLSEERSKRASMIQEMDAYIKESIYWQNKKFAVKR